MEMEREMKKREREDETWSWVQWDLAAGDEEKEEKEYEYGDGYEDLEGYEGYYDGYGYEAADGDAFYYDTLLGTSETADETPMKSTGRMNSTGDQKLLDADSNATTNFNSPESDHIITILHPPPYSSSPVARPPPPSRTTLHHTLNILTTTLITTTSIILPVAYIYTCLTQHTTILRTWTSMAVVIFACQLAEMVFGWLGAGVWREWYYAPNTTATLPVCRLQEELSVLQKREMEMRGRKSVGVGLGEIVCPLGWRDTLRVAVVVSAARWAGYLAGWGFAVVLVEIVGERGLFDGEGWVWEWGKTERGSITLPW